MVIQEGFKGKTGLKPGKGVTTWQFKRPPLRDIGLFSQILAGMAD